MVVDFAQTWQRPQWVDKTCVDTITSWGFTEVTGDVVLESKDTFGLLVFLIWFQALE